MLILEMLILKILMFKILMVDLAEKISNQIIDGSWVLLDN
jgi:hypothetical protein